MKRFIDKHQAKITGTISCFDRILFKGHLPLGWSSAMEQFIARRGLLIKEFSSFVQANSQRIKQHAKDMANKTGRPYIHLTGPVRKEERVRDIARRDKITQGLVCILAAVEGCRSFKIAYGKQRPKVVSARRKCLCLYFYFVDRDLRGLAGTVRRNGRSCRGFNPAADEDIRLFAAIMRGEHAINGFRNRDIRGQLFKPTQDTQERTRRSARVCRLLKRLHIHGLIAKIPRSRRWRVTSMGQSLMATLLILHHEQYPKLLTRRAA